MSRHRVRLQRGVGGGGVGDRRERGSVEPTSEGGWSCNRAAWLKTGRERRTTGGPGPREAHGAGLGGAPAELHALLRMFENMDPPPGGPHRQRHS